MKRTLIYCFIAISISTYGQVLDTTLFIQSDSLSYAIYIPNDQARDKAIFFFEPSARGSLPVNKYKPLADKYSISLIGSNDSRNGPLDLSISIMNQVIDHAIENHLQKESGIYLSGFSGGSRTSALHSLQDPMVKGVIGCGSGFPPGFQLGTLRCKYAGVIGNADMNYLEMIQNEGMLHEFNIENTLIEFNGNHSWPPVSSFEAALSWLLSEGKAFNEYYKAFADSLSSNNQLVSLDRIIKRLEKKEVQPGYSVDYSSKEYKKEKKKIDKLYADERAKQEEILDAFTAIRMSQYYAPSNLKGLDWWELLCNGLKRNMKKGGEEGLSASRLMNFIGANSYERGFFSLGESPDIAEKYFEIFSLASNHPWYGYFWLAKCNAIQADWKEVEKLLELAVKNGFSGFDNLENDPAFEASEAKEVLSKIRQDN